MARPLQYDHRIQIRIDKDTYRLWSRLALARGYGSLAAWLRQTCDDRAKEDQYTIALQEQRAHRARLAEADMIAEYERCHPRAKQQRRS